MIVTRGKSLEAPVGELRKANTVAFPHAEQHNVEQVAEKQQTRKVTTPALLTNMKEGSVMRSYGR